MARLTNLTERGHETRRLLRDVLMDLITEKGYEHIAIKDITARAGIDRSTFYLHFKDKDDLFTHSQHAIIDELMALRAKGSGPFPGVQSTFGHMAEHPRIYLALFRSAGAMSRPGSLPDYLAKSLSPLLGSQLRGHGIVPGSSSEPVAHFLAGALCSLARWWLEAGCPLSADEASALFLKLATRGLESLRPD